MMKLGKEYRIVRIGQDVAAAARNGDALALLPRGDRGRSERTPSAFRRPLGPNIDPSIPGRFE
jgi:hypothetical protein